MFLIAVTVTVTFTALAGFEAESRGLASTATIAPAGVIHRWRPLPMATSRRPTASRQFPARSPCVHNRRAQLIVVSIRSQHEWACAHHRTVLSTPVTTGATKRPGNATARGTYAVQGLDRDTVLTTSGGRRYRVNYWIPFHLGIWGFHDASWQTIPFGSKQYVTRGSHGCIHMPLTAIRWLFHWLHYGTPVRITA